MGERACTCTWTCTCAVCGRRGDAGRLRPVRVLVRCNRRASVRAGVECGSGQAPGVRAGTRLSDVGMGLLGLGVFCLFVKQYSYCTYFISTSRFHGEEESITCFSEVDWRVVFSRQTWYYLMFMLLFLSLYPFVSRPGQRKSCSSETERLPN